MGSLSRDRVISDHRTIDYMTYDLYIQTVVLDLFCVCKSRFSCLQTAIPYASGPIRILQLQYFHHHV